MNPSNPLRSITPTVDADVLFALARSHAPMTGYVIEKATGRAHAGVLKVLARLVDEGIVEREKVGQANRYRLNRAHLLAGPLGEAAESMARLEEQITSLGAQMNPAPVAVLLFGSFARRDGDSDSDVDLFVVRPENVEADDAGWLRSRSILAGAVEAASGNPCQLMEATPTELAEGIARQEDLIQSLRADAVCLFGSPPVEIRTPRLAEAIQ